MLVWPLGIRILAWTLIGQKATARGVGRDTVMRRDKWSYAG